jgi:alpha-glucuronidase
MNVNLENLTTRHGEKATEVFREIADLGGFGSVGSSEGQISPAYAGGLDIAGVLNPANTAVSSKAIFGRAWRFRERLQGCVFTRLTVRRMPQQTLRRFIWAAQRAVLS